MKTITETETVVILGRMAAIVSILMYVSYIPQIIDNLGGNKGNPIQPIVAACNCVLWVSYAFFKEQRDWPVIIANFPGIFFGAIAFATAL